MAKRSVIELGQRAFEIVRSQCYLDFGGPEDAVVLTGVARSGTTWLGGILQHASGARSLFEPFFPFYVRQSGEVGYFPYAGKESEWPELERFAAKVIGGKLRGKWVDRDNRSLCFRRRLIKEIRMQFMLGWLKQRYPQIPVILMVRSPLDLYASWAYLNWLEAKTDEHFAMQRLLFDRRFGEAYPGVLDFWYRQGFEPAGFAQFLYDWYLAYAIPMLELASGDYLLVGYEELRADFPAQLGRINAYLGTEYPLEPLQAFAARPSSTDYGNRQKPGAAGSALKAELIAAGTWATADTMLRQLCGIDLEAMCHNPAAALREALGSKQIKTHV